MPTCDICGVADDAPESTLSRASATASTGLARLDEHARTWMTKTYGLVPSLTCASCFLPALEGANQASWMARQL